MSRPGVLYAAFSEYDPCSFASLVHAVLVAPLPAYGQAADPGPAQNSPPSASSHHHRRSRHQDDQPPAPVAEPIPANAERMSRQTRFEIIRDFETQLVYSRAIFPMNTKGLRLRGDEITPNGEELRQALALWGPAIKPGDPAHISLVQIKDDHIHFEINGGPVRRRSGTSTFRFQGPTVHRLRRAETSHKTIPTVRSWTFILPSMFLR